MHWFSIQRRLGARSRIQGFGILYSLILHSYWSRARLVGSTSTLIQLSQSELTANQSLGYTLRSPQSYAQIFLTDPDWLTSPDSWLLDQFTPSRLLQILFPHPPLSSLLHLSSANQLFHQQKPLFYQVYHQRWLVPSRLPVSIYFIIFIHLSTSLSPPD